MAAVDVSSYLAPLEEAPSGEDLEYDPGYLELETVSRGKPEQQFGDTKVEAEEPDWREVNRLAAELLARTKDLRIAIHFLRAQVQLEGIFGLDAGLALIHGYVEQFWDTLHPQLDPEDDNDPAIRLNTLAAMCDASGMLRDIRKLPLTRSRQLGRLSYRDYLVATGALELPEGATPVDIRLIDGAFADTDSDFLKQQSAALDSAIGHLTGIDRALTAALGSGYNLDLKPLSKLLYELKKLLGSHMAETGAAPAPSDEGDAATGGPGEAASQQRSGRMAVSAPGQIQSQTDVLTALDKIIQYYRLNEPSHPLPVLLERAKRLVAMDFVELLKELAPEGMSNFRNVAGLSED